MRSLCAQRREGALVVGVDGTAARSAATGRPVKVATATSTTLTTTATALAATTRTTTTLATSTTSTTTAATALTRVDRSVVLAVHREEVLRLVLLLASLLTARAGEVVLLLAGESLALGELLLGAFVGLAEGKVATTKCEALLGLLGQVLVVRLGLLFWLGVLLTDLVRAVAESWVGTAGVWGEARVVVNLSLGDSGSSGLVGKFTLASLGTPAVGSLLVVLSIFTSDDGLRMAYKETLTQR